MKKPLSFRLLLGLSLLPILFFPMIFMATIYIFDNPYGNPVYQYALFIGINAYPLYLLANAIWSYKIYAKNRKIAYGLVIWPTALMGLMLLMLLFA